MPLRNVVCNYFQSFKVASVIGVQTKRYSNAIIQESLQLHRHSKPRLKDRFQKQTCVACVPPSDQPTLPVRCRNYVSVWQANRKHMSPVGDFSLFKK